MQINILSLLSEGIYNYFIPGTYMYLLTWMPYAIVCFFSAFSNASNLPTVVAVLHVPPILAKCGSAVNLIIYIATKGAVNIHGGGGGGAKLDRTHIIAKIITFFNLSNDRIVYICLMPY